MEYSEIKKKLDQDGWVVVKGFFSKKKISLNKKKIFDFLRKNHLNYNGRFINYFDSEKKFLKINSFHKLEDCNSVKNFYYKEIFKLAYNLFDNSEPELRASELFKKPKLNGLKAAPHQDDYYWNVKKNKGITIWIALDKANKTNGSVYYYTSSHNLGLVSHKPSFGKGTSQTIANLNLLKKFKKQHVNVDTGDIVIHNTLVVHGSNVNKSKKNRTGWTFAIKPKKIPYDKQRTKKFIKSLYYQISFREKKSKFN